MTAHLYTRGHQPATRHHVGLGPGGGFWVRIKPRAEVWTSCCRTRRWAKHCTVQVYYDMVPFWCRAGRGCKVPKRRAPLGRTLLREFQTGLSFVGLARKYGVTRATVQAAVRRACR